MKMCDTKRKRQLRGREIDIRPKSCQLVLRCVEVISGDAFLATIDNELAIKTLSQAQADGELTWKLIKTKLSSRIEKSSRWLDVSDFGRASVQK
jgi:hypothetical protein